MSPRVLFFVVGNCVCMASNKVQHFLTSNDLQLQQLKEPSPATEYRTFTELAWLVREVMCRGEVGK
jgi:hypothetical protein